MAPLIAVKASGLNREGLSRTMFLGCTQLWFSGLALIRSRLDGTQEFMSFGTETMLCFAQGFFCASSPQHCHRAHLTSAPMEGKVSIRKLYVALKKACQRSWPRPATGPVSMHWMLRP